MSLPDLPQPAAPRVAARSGGAAMSTLIRAIGLLSIVFVPGLAQAFATCGVSALALNFGNYDHLNPFANFSQTTITVSCQENALIGLGDTVIYTIGLDGGSSGDTSNRALNQGGDNLHYNLYSEPTHTLVWGDDSGNQVGGVLAVPLCVLGLGCAVVSAPHTAYGRIPAGQSVSPGSYSDTITVTVTY
ncbi:MAG: SCPU domain-containing protein [Oceanococcus sp.]|nr:MAG: SCPU domain-containing protein [Oceanococcus sp.]